jgi:hypothetical protein
MKKPKKVVAHTDIVVDGEGYNLAVHKDSEAGWLMNMRPDVPSEKAESIAMKFWKVMGTGDGWPTLAEAQKAIGAAIKKTRAKWNGWHRETYD